MNSVISPFFSYISYLTATPNIIEFDQQNFFHEHLFFVIVKQKKVKLLEPSFSREANIRDLTVNPHACSHSHV